MSYLLTPFISSKALRKQVSPPETQHPAALKESLGLWREAGDVSDGKVLTELNGKTGEGGMFRRKAQLPLLILKL